MLSWKKTLLALLVITTGLQGITAFLSDREHLWSLPLELAPAAVVWFGYAYRYAPRFRVWIVQLLAHFGDQFTSAQVVARFTVVGDVQASNIVRTIRNRYPGDKTASAVKDYPSGGHTMVEMPGWSVRFIFSTPALAETEYVEEEDLPPAHDVVFTRTDKKESIQSTTSLLDSDVLPLFQELTKALPLTLASIEVKVRFLKQPNPYLAAYLQNVDLDKIAALRCELDEEQAGATATITRDTITVRATTLLDLRNLVRKHLSLQWTIR